MTVGVLKAASALTSAFLLAAPAPFPGMGLSQTKYAAYGDSITAGWGASGPSAWYVNLLAQDAGATVSNYGIMGQMTCGIAALEVFANHVFQQTDGASYVTLMAGTNDAYTEDLGVSEMNFDLCEEAALTWLAVPYAQKATPPTATCVKTGTWSANASLPDGLSSQTQGDTMTCSLATTGGPLYVWYYVADGNGGQFTYLVDDGLAETVSEQSSLSLSGQPLAQPVGVFLIRVPGLASGNHQVTFTVTSATSTSNTVTLFGIGTPPPVGAPAAPRVFMTGVPYEEADARSAQTAQFNADAMSNIATVQADGLPVTFVDVRQYWHGTPADMNDPLHPNDVGHSEIRDAFEATITGLGD